MKYYWRRLGGALGVRIQVTRKVLTDLMDWTIIATDQKNTYKALFSRITMNLKELPPVKRIRRPDQLRVIFPDEGEDLEIQLGSGIHVGSIYIGEAVPEEMIDGILEAARRYQISIFEQVQQVERISDSILKDQGYAKLFLESVDANWVLPKVLENMGFQLQPPITRLFNREFEMWDHGANRFNIVDVILPFKFQRGAK